MKIKEAIIRLFKIIKQAWYMKRIIAFVIFAMMLFFCACQPTPDVEYVVNKGDNVAEERINATALPTAAPSAVGGQTPSPTEIDYSSPWADWTGQAVFPEHWEDNIKTIAKEIIISADVVTSGQESYPVQLVRRTKFKTDDILKIANYLFKDETVTGWLKGSRPTREYLIEAMQRVASSDMPEQDKQVQLDALNMDLSNASLTDSDITQCSSLDDITIGWGRVTVFTESGGGILQMEDEVMRVNMDLYGIVQPRSWFDFDPPAPEFVPEIGLEEAKSKADELIKAMGFEGFELYSAEEARCVNDYSVEVYDTGWELRFTRSYGYIPFSVLENDASQTGLFQLGSKDGEVSLYSAPVKEESLILYVTGSGIKSVTMKNPYEYVATVNENVQLMDFDELTTRIKRMVSAGATHPIQIQGYFVLEEMILTVMPQPKKDSSDYYLMPVWVCKFGSYYSMDGPVDAHYYSTGEQIVNHPKFTLAFNAIDGTSISLPEL